MQRIFTLTNSLNNKKLKFDKWIGDLDKVQITEKGSPVEILSQKKNFLSPQRENSFYEYFDLRTLIYKLFKLHDATRT